MNLDSSFKIESDCQNLNLLVFNHAILYTFCLFLDISESWNNASNKMLNKIFSVAAIILYVLQIKHIIFNSSRIVEIYRKTSYNSESF